jgi:hypothetical protein
VRQKAMTQIADAHMVMDKIKQVSIFPAFFPFPFFQFSSPCRDN